MFTSTSETTVRIYTATIDLADKEMFPTGQEFVTIEDLIRNVRISTAIPSADLDITRPHGPVAVTIRKADLCRVTFVAFDGRGLVQVFTINQEPPVIEIMFTNEESARACEKVLQKHL